MGQVFAACAFHLKTIKQMWYGTESFILRLVHLICHKGRRADAADGAARRPYLCQRNKEFRFGKGLIKFHRMCRQCCATGAVPPAIGKAGP